MNHVVGHIHIKDRNARSNRDNSDQPRHIHKERHGISPSLRAHARSVQGYEERSSPALTRIKYPVLANGTKRLLVLVRSLYYVFRRSDPKKEETMLEKRKLGRTDLSVTSICLGTMTWGEQNTEQEGHAQLDYARGFGINFIDTAELYSIPPRPETQGSTERIIGSWLKARGGRDKLVIATKVTGRSSINWIRPGGKPPRLDEENIRYAIEQSLKRLQTDYIDLYQLHWPDRDVGLFGATGTTFKDIAHPDNSIPIKETLGVLGKLVAEGKVRHVGVSNETAWGVSRFLCAHEADKGPRIVSVQNAYNLLNRTFELGLAEVALRENVGLLAYSPLGQGYLTGKYQNGALPLGARTTLFGRGQRYQKPGVEEAVAAYLRLAQEFRMDPAQMALAFVTSRKFVTSNIIGATTLEQLKTDLESADITISEELEHRLNEIHQIHQNPAP
jgi:aryl-alcohol dehydrogenase-like predicted oxidoreductase